MRRARHIIGMDAHSHDGQQLSLLNIGHPLYGDAMHECRMLVFPKAVRTGTFQHSSRYELFTARGAVRRVCQAALRFFHESIMTQASKLTGLRLATEAFEQRPCESGCRLVDRHG